MATPRSNVVWYVVACVAVGGGVGFWQLQRERAADVQAERAQRQQDLQHTLDHAIASLKARDWRSATVDLSDLEASDDNFEKTRVAELKATARRELTVATQLTQANEHLEKDELAAAEQALDGIARDTVQTDQVDATRARFDGKLSERLEEARGLAGKTRDPEAMARLLALSEDWVAAMPRNLDAQAMRDLAESSLAKLTPPIPGPSTPRHFDDVKERFKAGDLAGAKALAQACAPKSKECRAQLKLLLEFERQLANISTATPAQLQSLVNLSRRLSPDGELSALISAPVHRAAAEAVTAARNLWRAGKYKAGLAQARQALALDLKNTEAATFIADAHTFAEQLYATTRSGSPGDPILRMKAVLEMTSPTDDLHRQAQRYLDSLRK